MADVLDFAPFPALSSAGEMKRLRSIFDQQAAASVKPEAKARRIPPAVVAAVLDWVILDRRVVVRDRNPIGRADGEEGDFFPVASSATTVDEEEGVEIRSDLHLHAPPMCSLSILVGALGPEDLQSRPDQYWPTIVGADADRVLIQMERTPAAKLYVYTADGGHSTIDILPPCKHRTRLGRDAAVLSRKDEYGVAILNLRHVGLRPNPPVEATVSLFRSSSPANGWVALNFELPGVDWTDQADAAVPYMDCICWVFFERENILVCDVLKEDPDTPRMIRLSLPRCASGYTSNHRRFRTVAVADSKLKFVEVDRTATPNGARVSIWSLDQKGYEWILQGRLQVQNCGVRGVDAPIYPLPCATDPDLLYLMTPQPDHQLYGQNFHRLYGLNWRTANLVSLYSLAEDRWQILRGKETAYLGSQHRSLCISPAQGTRGCAWPPPRRVPARGS